MKKPRVVKVTTPTEHEIAIPREFNAPRQEMFAALTKPEIIKR